MKKLLSLSLMLSLGLATVTPALNAVAQSQIVAQSQANPADVSGWQAAKKWWRSGRNMKALNRQEQRAFNALKKQFTIGAIIAAIVAMIGGGAAYLHHKSADGAADVFAGPSGVAVPPRQIGFAPRATGPVVAPVVPDYLGQELIQEEPTYVDAVPYIVPVPYVDAVPYVAPVVPDYLGQELITAARRGDKTKVEKLIAAGANVNAQNDVGSTALMYAATEGYYDIVEKLLKVNGINVNAANQDGWTALMFAAHERHLPIVVRLLPYATPENRAKAIQLAIKQKDTDLAKIIEGRFGRPTKPIWQPDTAAEANLSPEQELKELLMQDDENYDEDKAFALYEELGRPQIKRAKGPAFKRVIELRRRAQRERRKAR